VGDATADDRFRANPLELWDMQIRFYAGMPLITDGGHALGALCVVDCAPRQFDAKQRESLRQQKALRDSEKQMACGRDFIRKIADRAAATSRNVPTTAPSSASSA
jgi:GAF domain-containing protein